MRSPTRSFLATGFGTGKAKWRFRYLIADSLTCSTRAESISAVGSISWARTKASASLSIGEIETVPIHD